MHKLSTFRAPAKINLCLHVLGRREDGYHELESLMQRVALYDEIHLALLGEPGIKVDCPGVELAPGADNLVAQAARLFFAATGIEVGVRIGVVKRIPVAAGLGGGSSDAATVLLGLNRMLGEPLPVEQLAAIGVRLGADVPFFIYERAAWAGGIGEVLDPVADLPSVCYLLVNPNIQVSTAGVFRDLGLTSTRQAARMREFPSDARELVRLFHNDLEPVTCARYPVVAEIKQQLLVAGALGSLMSGSGATVFGLFQDEQAAGRVADELAAGFGWSYFCCPFSSLNWG